MGAVVVAVPWRDAEPTWCSAQKNTHLEISDLFCAQRYAAVSLLLFKTAKHTWTIHSIILKEVTKRPWETFFQSSTRYAPAAHQQRVLSPRQSPPGPSASRPTRGATCSSPPARWKQNLASAELWRWLRTYSPAACGVTPQVAAVPGCPWVQVWGQRGR